MRTIIISSFHPLISRNILGTPLLSLLLERQDVRVTVMVSRKKEAFFRDFFESPRIRIAPIDADLAWRDRFMRYAALAALRTRALAIKRRTEMRGSGSLLCFLIGNQKWSRALLRALNRALTPTSPFAELFMRERPALVFATDVQNEYDVRMMAAARGARVPVVGMVRSWDNLSSKGLIRFVPDLLVVHNAIVGEEATRLHGVSAHILRKVGIPHYDAYRKSPRAKREEFLGAIRADSGKRIILFAPVGDRYLVNNTIDRDVLALLRRAAPSDCQILVRFPPQDVVANLEDATSDDRVIFERPKTRYTVIPRKTELTREMDQHLADTLHHAAVVVAGPSTLAIDAALFGKPVILINFDGRDGARPYYTSVRRYYDYEHWDAMRASKGVVFALSEQELIEALRVYLADPHRDEEARRNLVQAQAWRLDGQASKRLALVLLSHLDAVAAR